MKETHDFLKDNNNKRQGDENDRSRSNDSNVSHGRSRGRFGSSAGKTNVDADQSSEQSRGRSRRKGAAKQAPDKISDLEADQTSNRIAAQTPELSPYRKTTRTTARTQSQASGQTRSHREVHPSGNEIPKKLPRFILAFMILIAAISGVLFFFYKIGTFDRMASAFTEAVEGFNDLSIYAPDAGAGSNTDITEPGSPQHAAADGTVPVTDPSSSDDLSGAANSNPEHSSSGTPSGEADHTTDHAASDTASNGSGLVSDPTGKYSALLNDPERMEAENCHALDDGGDGVITLRFAGDVLLDDSYAIAAYQRELSGGYLIAENAFDSNLLGLMRGADIFMLNNEFPYTLRGEPAPEKQFTFRAFPADVSFLNDIGADIVTLANNHVYDYGEISLLDSMDTLKNAGIAYAGAGHDLEEASSPVYFVSDDVKIAIIASTQIERMPNPDTKGATADTPGVFRSMELDELTAAIREAKEVSDFVIVFTHWGTEGAAEPDWSQNEQAPLIAEAGADLIIGAHPHVLQKIDYEEETPVFYSLGNYLFNSKTLDTCLAEVNIDASDGSLLSVRFIPALQSGCKVSSFEGEEYGAALERMRALSPDVNIDEEGYVTPK